MFPEASIGSVCQLHALSHTVSGCLRWHTGCLCQGRGPNRGQPINSRAIHDAVWALYKISQCSSAQLNPVQPSSAPTLSAFGKHRGKRFSEVLAEDPSYVEWAMKQEQYLRQVRREAASDTLEDFIEYVQCKECSAKFDRAYKEGITVSAPRLNQNGPEGNQQCTKTEPR